jgi:hypothetical protein
VNPNNQNSLLILRTCPSCFLGLASPPLTWFVCFVLLHFTPCVRLFFMLPELILCLEWLTALAALVLASLAVLCRLLLRHYYAPLVI